jgi:hypothetical protein
MQTTETAMIFTECWALLFLNYLSISRREFGSITGNIKLSKPVPFKRAKRIPLDVEYVMDAIAFPRLPFIIKY